MHLLPPAQTVLASLQLQPPPCSPSPHSLPAQPSCHLTLSCPGTSVETLPDRLLLTELYALRFLTSFPISFLVHGQWLSQGRWHFKSDNHDSLVKGKRETKSKTERDGDKQTESLSAGTIFSCTVNRALKLPLLKQDKGFPPDFWRKYWYGGFMVTQDPGSFYRFIY